ncbi:MAG: aminomethyl-transferring glycine dehydrogenase subunit GcvPA [Candidatus Bathyarchaeota archaeon]|nr:aminomethyl-transferring glycine dehydrogenase subunit GcvPA [Candidatus Bathyarchaeota archaeon]
MTEIFPHPFVANSALANWKKMLGELKIESAQDLFSDIPSKFLVEKKLNLASRLSESEAFNHVSGILSKNISDRDMLVFVGAGVWPHYVPAAVSEIISRSEFLTSYTQYQPEASQGMLMALFEYQSLMAELLEMDVVNSSMYDWATALGEAGRMSKRLTGRKEVIIPRFTSPDRRAVLQTYIDPMGMKIIETPQSGVDGQIIQEKLKDQVSSDTAAIYLENPSYLGFLETEVEAIAEISHDAGALFIVGVDPTSLGILRPPGDYEADIVVGEGQPLGSPVNFGGPLLGILACKDDMKMIRAMPGRIIGMTTTIDETQKAFAMSMQTREQHIRREKATSNICTNNALCALASAVYISLLGKSGIRQLSEQILAKTKYAIRRFSSIGLVDVPLFKAPHFKEFTIRFRRKQANEVLRGLLENKICGGKALSSEFPELGESVLVCVTELHSGPQIDKYVDALDQLLR